jgi:hypothetical protein
MTLPLGKRTRKVLKGAGKKMERVSKDFHNKKEMKFPQIIGYLF